MLAVTESLPVGPRSILAPQSRESRSVPTAFERASSHSKAHWYPSARTAVQAALRDAGIEGDDEVLLPGYTCHAVDEAVSRTATPVYVDVHRDSTLDLGAASEQVTPDTAAIVPTHLYGIECDMDAVSRFASDHGIVVIEDAAQALANLFTSEQIGTRADYTAFSFRFYKEITAFTGGLLLGEQGDRSPQPHSIRFGRGRLLGIWALDRLFASLPGRVYQPLREHLLDPFARSASAPAEPPPPGRPDDWTRRVLSVQIEELDDRVAARKRNATCYDDLLPDDLERVGSSRPSSLFRYPVRIPDGHRDALLRQARRRGIGCSSMYAYTVSPMGDCPTADTLAAEILHLPVHAGLDRTDVSTLARTVTSLWQELGP